MRIKLRPALRQLAARLLARLSTERLAAECVALITALAGRLPAERALRLLLELDARLYPLQGAAAVRSGGGTHPKHRLMGYHDFFCTRIGPNDRVIDIGCGNGALARDLARRTGARITAVDSDPRQIALACRHRPPGLTVMAVDAHGPLPAGDYEVIVLSNVLEHLTSRPERLAAFVRETGARRLLIRVPLRERDWRVPLKRELGIEWRLDPTHETEYTVTEFRAELAAAGVVPVHLEQRWGEIWCEAHPRKP